MMTIATFRQVRHAIRAMANKPALVDRETVSRMSPLIMRHFGRGLTPDADLYADVIADADFESAVELATRLAAPMIIPAGKNGKATAFVSMRGTALYDTEFQPFCFSTLLLSKTMNMLADDPNVGTVVLDIDSPGGAVTGTAEAAESVWRARKTGTRVVALVNPFAASAAYWIASQADEIITVPSGDVGSIGVFMMHCDMSAAMEAEGFKITFIREPDTKAAGNPFEPLSEKATEHFTGEIRTIYRDFLKAVSRGRGVPVSTVVKDFSGGFTFMAQRAKAAGMVDVVAPLGVLLARVGINEGTMESRRRGEDVEGGESELATAALAYFTNAASWEVGEGDDIIGTTDDDDPITAVADVVDAVVNPDDLPRRVDFRNVRRGERWRVFDANTGDEIDDVLAVDLDEGYLIQGVFDDDGYAVMHKEDDLLGPGCRQYRRVHGNFRIEQITTEPGMIQMSKRHDGGTKFTAFVDHPWPDMCAIDFDFMHGEFVDPDALIVDDDEQNVVLKVANGWASYHVSDRVEPDPNKPAQWVGYLVNSEYEPREDFEKREADDREKRARDVRRRHKLAMSRHI